jgi:D-tyrosyl-tRNA(Tyr) deacylase
MRLVIQRVRHSSVAINGKITGRIGAGLLILIGVEHEDTVDDAQWLAGKVAGLRVFSDENGMMNLDIQKINGKILVVSQFTLHASTKKGNRPSFIRAAKTDQAILLYEHFISKLQENGIHVERGVFGAMMEVTLVNDGPVTILMDSKNKE